MALAIHQATPVLPAELRDHNGGLVDANQVFFQEPPKEIGRILSSHSTLKVGQKPRPWRRFILPSLMALPFLVCGGWTFRYDSNKADVGAWIFFGLAVFTVVYACLRFKHCCTYAGAEGVARFTIKDSLLATPISVIFLFERAVNLRVSSTLQDFDGVSFGIKYSYTWHDQRDREVFVLEGRHLGEKSPPKIDSLYWYAFAAENAWTHYKLGWFEGQLAAYGYAPFVYDGVNEVRVGPGFFEFAIKGVATRINSDDIKHIKLENGRFDIQHKDAKWFSGKGKFSFIYASMNNARLFLYATERLVGYKFG